MSILWDSSRNKMPNRHLIFLRVKKHEGSAGKGVEMKKKLYSVLIACMFSLLLFAVNSAVGQNRPGRLPFGVSGDQPRLGSLGSPSVIEMSERQILSSIHRRTNPEKIAAKSAPAAPGDLDPTFGTGGKAFTSFGRLTVLATRRLFRPTERSLRLEQAGAF